MANIKKLTPQQVNEVMAIIDQKIGSFIAFGIDQFYLTDYEKWLLRHSGFEIADIKPHESEVTQAFKFGMLSNSIEESIAKKMTYKDFRQALQKKEFWPLTPAEEARLGYVKQMAVGDVRVFGSRVSGDIRRIIMEEAQKGITQKATAAKISREIGKRAGNWDRDFGKIAEYVLHHSFNEGRVSYIQRKGGKNAKVWFDVYPGACKYCIKLYLTNGFGSQPIIFDVETLRNNGTNIGRKPEEYKATIAGIHPFCRCTANEHNDRYEWDPETRGFTKPKEVDEKYRGLVKVTVEKDK